MLPVIAIVGRANVGKSTLFNALTKTQDALVFDFPGVTRDRRYGEGKIGQQAFIVIDTGGIGEETQEIDAAMCKQSWQAIEEADFIFFVVDAQANLTALDTLLFNKIRKGKKKVFCVVNKIDGLDANLILPDFYSLGIKKLYPIAAISRRGIQKLIEAALENWHFQDDQKAQSAAKGIQVAVVGRPNVGKSTLINRLLGESRLVVFDAPGTTRDSIFIPFEKNNQTYTLIDTAGIRRRAKIKQVIEKFSIIKSLQAIEQAHVAILVLEATTELAQQDLFLLDFILKAGRALVICVNKWDGLSEALRTDIKGDLGRRLNFLNAISFHFISAKTGSGVGVILKSVNRAYESAMKKFASRELTEILQQALEKHPPPLVRGRRIKLRYAHSGGHNPQLIVIHGNQTEALPQHYKTFLMKTFIERLKLEGTPLKLVFKTSENPYKEKRNVLTPRQARKRKRLLKHAKKQEKKK